MMTREKLLKELSIQEKIEGETENTILVRAILKHLKNSSDLGSFFTVKHHRYGKLSYETHIFRYVKENIKEMFSDLMKNKLI